MLSVIQLLTKSFKRPKATSRTPSSSRGRIGDCLYRGRVRHSRLEWLEPRLMLTNVAAGAVAGTWTVANSPYVLQGNAWVSPGTSLQIQPGVVVRSSSGTYNLQYQTGSSGSITTASFTSASLTISESSIAVTGSTFASTVYCTLPYVSQLVNNTSFGVVDVTGGTLSQNVTLSVLGSGMTQYQLDSNLTVAAGVSLTLNAGTRLYLNQGVSVTVNGALAINNAAWVQQHYYNGDQTGFVVNSGGTMTVTNTTFSGVNDGYGGTAYLTVNNGGGLTASGCSFSLNWESLVAGSTLSLTNNTFGGTLYCTLPYVSQLTNNTSFGIVDISGGTLSQNVTLNAMGSSMTQYQLDSNLTIAPGVNLTLNAGTRLLLNQGVSVTVNGALAINNAAWVQEHYYNGDQTGFVVNSGGTMTVTNTTLSGVNDGYGGTAYLTVNNGGGLTASGCTFSLSSVTIAGNVFAETDVFATPLTLGAGSNGAAKYDTFTYNGYNYFNGGMSVNVTENDFSASKAESQGGGGPVNLSNNYWGATTDATIRSQHIYDNANSSSLPVINIDPFLTTAAVLGEHLTFTMQPTATTAGATITPAVQISVEDGSGSVVVGDNSSVTVALGANPGSATLAGTLTVAAINGVATFSNLSINNAGTGYTLTATDGSMTGATSGSFSVTPIPAIVTAVSPSSGSVTGGTSVTITGTGLAAATAVTFGGKAATITSDTATQIVAASPAGTGLVDVTVTTAAGTSAISAADKFSYVAPNLVVGTLTVPATATLGQPVSVSWTDVNQGTAAATGRWNDGIYLYTSPAGAGPIFVGSATFNGTLPVGQSTTQSATLTLPLNLVGTYYFGVTADYLGQVAEGSNSRLPAISSLATSIQEANLLAESVQPAATSVQFGEPLSVTWTALNVGSGTAIGAWSDQLYLCSQPTLNASATLLLTQSEIAHSPLAAGASYSATAVANLPLSTSLAPGSYYVIAVINSGNSLPETSTSNNQVASTAITIVEPPLPDLVVSSATGPAQGVTNQQAIVSWTDQNVGAATATGPWIDTVYLMSADLSKNLGSLGQFTFNGTLTSGGSASRSVPVMLPSAPGSYRFEVATNSTGTVVESNTSNDTLATPTATLVAQPSLPDLVVSRVTPPTNPLSGTTVPITFVVTNQGNAPTSAPVWYDYAFISQDPNLTFNGVSDQTITNVVVSEEGVQPEAASNPSYLAPGESYQQTINVTVPPNAQGTWYAYAVANGLGGHFAHRAAFVESNIANNLTASGGFTVALNPQPVMSVSNVQANAQEFSGKPMNVSWKVTNIGAGASLAGGWTDAVYLSPDSTLDAKATLLGTFAHSGGLAVGGSYNNAQTVNLPVALNSQLYSGAYYVLVQTGYNTGNVSDTPITVNLTPPPDLAASITSAPTTALASHGLTFTYKVTNSGAGATPNNGWTDAYYLSTTAALNTNTAILLGQQVHGGSLAAGVNYSNTVTATLPNALSGTYYLFVETDIAGAVIELPSDTQNKLSTPATVHVSSQPADLIVSAANAPSTGVAGASVTVNWTVTNQGTGDTAVTNWTDNVYADTSAAMDSHAVLIGSFTHFGLLNAGGSYSQSQAVSLPQGLSGSYNLFVVTNANQAVFEGTNTGNDTSAAMPISIALQLPNLVVSGVSATGSAGSGSALLVRWTVTNEGTGGTGATFWQDNVYADTSTTLDANAVLLGSFTHSGALAPGQSYSQSELVTLPISLSGGSYNLFVVTNEPAPTQTNPPVVVSNPPSSTSPPLPTPVYQQLSDLLVTSVTAPVTAATGSTAAVSWTVENDGAGATNVNYWTDAVWISTHSTLNSGGTDVYLGNVPRSNPLAVGSSYTASANFAIPQTVAAGTYYFIVATNSGGQVDESNLNNDSAAAGSTTSVSLGAVANLSVSNVTAPATATAGQVLPVSWTVTNSGANTGNVPITDSIYLSYDTVFDPASERYLGSLTHSGGLAAGASYTQSDNIQLPAGLAGTFHVFVQTNSSGTVYERSASPIAAFSAQPLQINLAPPADLVAGTVTIPVNAVVGQNFTVSYQVTNNSSVAANGTWFDSLYLSPTNTWNYTDPLLGRVAQTHNLAPGGSYTGTLTAPLPGVTPGTYYVVLRTNILNNFPELTQSNNLSASLTQSSVAAQALTLGTAAAGTLANGQSAFYEVAVGANQTLNVNFNSQESASLNELYVSFGTMPTRGQYGYRFQALGANQKITVPTTQAGTYYILAYGSSVPASPESYSLTASLVPFSITAIGPSQVGAGTATIEIDGSKFDNNTTFQLLGPSSQVVNAQRVQVQDSSTAFATFDLSGMPTGAYSAQATQPGGTTTKLAKSLTVVAASPPMSPQIYLSVPKGVLPGRQGEVTVNYTNLGNTDILAPFLELTATNALLQLSDQVNFSSEVQFLGTSGNGPAGTLRPGESGSVSIVFEATGSAGQQIHFQVQIGDDSQPVDWADQQAALRLPSIPTAAWAGVFANFVCNVGNTMAGYHAALAADATYLSSLGEPMNDVIQLTGFEFQKANAGYTAQTLATVTAAGLPAPGMDLTFTQSFLQSIGGRYYQGILGNGWTTNWDISIKTVTGGNAAFIASGEHVLYSRQSDGSYQDELGIHDALTLTNGAYRLTEPGGAFYQFNANGTLNYVQDSHGNQITCGYNAQNQLVTLTASNGEFLALAYNAWGHLATLTDSNGQTETYGYDPTGQFLTSYNDIYGTTTYTYVTGQSPQQNNALAEIAYADNTHIFLGFDSQGRLIDQHRDGGAEDLTFTYLSGGNGYTTTDADHNSTTTLFDRYGATAETINALGNATHYYYDSNLNLTSIVGPGGTTYTYTYDANGNETSATDPLGNSTTFTYNTSNDLTSYTDAKGNKTAYAYNSANDLLATTYADGTTQSSTYNPLGEATSFVNANGKATAMQYNADGLVTQETFADGSSFTYTYDVRGNMLTATSTGGTIAFSYTNTANPDLLTEVQYADGTFLKFSYNVVGQRTQSVDQTGYTVNYIYDAVGRLSKLTDGSGKLIVQYGYDAAGNLVQKDNGNGTRTVYTYTAVGNVLTITNLAPNHTTVNSFDNYTYDALGDVLTDTNQDGQWVYSYDADSQLTQAVFTPNIADPDGLAVQNLQYVYDAAGNRLSETVNGVLTTYVANNMNEYTASTTAGVGTTTYHYDNDGNLTTEIAPGGTTSYTFNQLNRLTAVNGGGVSATYAYDPLGNRIAQTINGATTNFQIDPAGLGNVVAAYASTSGPVTHYTYGFGLVNQVSSAGVAAYYDFNNIGSTVGITSAAGTYVNKYSYLPFGQTITIAAALTNPYTFVGEAGVQNDGTGLLNMRARNYNPALGRFAQPDPLGLLGGGVGLERYAGNHPINAIDPWGLQFLDASGNEISSCQEMNGELNPELYGLSCRDYLQTVPAVPQFLSPEVAKYLSEHGWQIAGTIVVLPIAWADVIAASEAEELAAQIEALTRLLDKADYLNKLWNGEHLQRSTGSGSGCPCECIPSSNPVTPNNDGPDVNCPINHSTDPNNLIGPTGFGDANFVSANQSLPYTVDFENEPTAGPAQQVVITQQLDANLNWESFRLGSFGFGGQIYQAPANTAYYQTQIDLTATEGFYVDVTATIDERTGIATWIFTTIDPATGQTPLDPGIGFLPPDDSSGAGEGFVSYTIEASPAAATGTVVNALATVTFDTQPPMNTPQVSNTIDTGAGVASAVASLPATGTSPDFLVSWSGTDAAKSAGIASYTIYVSDNDGPYTAWLQNTPLTSATFAGQYYHTYRFFSLATDNVGTVQPAKFAADASTTIIPAGVPTWLGGGADNCWSTAANWSTLAAPSAGANVAFFGTAQITTNNDLTAGTLLKSLNLVSPGFVLSGNGVTLASNSGPVVTLAATSGTINLPITLAGNATFADTDVPGSLTVSGNIDNGGYNLTVNTGSTEGSTLSGSISGAGGFIKSGAGTVTLSGTNKYKGGTFVTGGTLVVTSSTALPDGGALTVGAGGAFTLVSSVQATSAAVVAAAGTAIVGSAGTNAPIATSSAIFAATSSETVVAAAAPSAPIPASSTVAAPKFALPLQVWIPGPQTEHRSKPILASALRTPPANKAVWSSTTKKAAGELAWLVQAANNSGYSDQQRSKKDVAALALDAVFAEYGR